MNPIPQFENKDINTRDLCIDDYQRELEDGRVKRIVKEFNLYLVNDVKVSFRDGKYWIFDGQHTVSGIKMHNGGKDCMVRCKVFYGLTHDDEAELFCLQNGISKSVPKPDKLKADYSRKEKNAVKLVETARRAGWILDFSKERAQNRLHALGALCRAYGILTLKQYEDMLTILKAAWYGNPESVRNEILDGLSIFIKTYDGEYNRQTLISHLQRTSPVAIVRDGKALSFGGKTRYARVILIAYNNKTHNKLPDKL